MITSVFGWWIGLTTIEWSLILLCIGLVLAAEMFNSSIEILADRVTREYDPMIRDVKDHSAGAVLALSIATAIVGAIIFAPHLF